MLTPEQKRNIRNLDTETKIEILHECAEALGLVDIDEYCHVMGMKRRNAYYKIENKNIKSITIGRHVFPMVNA
jgi:hypothetical protein